MSGPVMLGGCTVSSLGDGAVAQAAREEQAAIRKASPWLQA
jgi:hypothetical protein